MVVDERAKTVQLLVHATKRGVGICALGDRAKEAIHSKSANVTLKPHDVVTIASQTVDPPGQELRYTLLDMFDLRGTPTTIVGGGDGQGRHNRGAQGSGNDDGGGRGGGSSGGQDGASDGRRTEVSGIRTVWFNTNHEETVFACCTRVTVLYFVLRRVARNE